MGTNIGNFRPSLRNFLGSKHFKACAETFAPQFLVALGADEAQIEASFCAAISTAKEQKSVSLEKRAEAT
jgi:hypothetical protein